MIAQELTVAALFVARGGCYYGVAGVDPWDDRRDARLYAGPWPVVAHPPCGRWSRLAGLVEARRGLPRGEDGGCFAAAIDAVRWFGGVLEHPEASAAWPAFGISRPVRGWGWATAGDGIGWTCYVEQGAYGHRARKPTWLYAVRADLPLVRAPARGSDFARVDGGPKERALRAYGALGKTARKATPLAFRDLLIGMARSVYRIADRSAGVLV
jgi:hypothetical protein